MNKWSDARIALWTGCLVFFGYFFLSSSIPLVAPPPQQAAIAVSLEKCQPLVLAFLAFLGLFARYVDKGASKATDLVKPEAETASTSTTIGKTSRKPYVNNNTIIRLHHIANENRRVAINALSYRASALAALQFAICHIVAAGIQGLAQKYYPPAQFSGFIFGAIIYMQTEILLVCAFFIPYRLHAGFIRDTKSSQAYAFGMKFRLGFLGIFGCGLISLITLSPEQIFPLLGNESLKNLPILGINYYTYLALIRLILFPFIGLLGSFAGVKTSLRR